MPKEAPFIVKGLKLVSLSIIIATIAIAASAAYSGYEEYGALSSMNGSTASQLNLVLNDSTLTLTGLSVPNKMTFPLTFELLGTVSLGNATIGNFDSGTYVIQPNESQNVNVSIPLSFASLVNDGSALRQAILNSTELSINATISARMVPLLGINITRATNTTAGPILGDLSVAVNSNGAKLSDDGSTVEVPMIISWQNTSPLSKGSLWLNANLTQIPGRLHGNYGSSSGYLNFTQGLNQQTFELSLPVSDFSGKSIPTGEYSVNLALSQSPGSEPFLEMTKTVSI
jgi:hypothetical protein